MNPFLEVSFTSEFDNLAQVEPIVNEIVAHTGLNPDQANNLMLSFSEALTNAILHGNKQDPEKQVTVTAKKDKKAVYITIEDEGEGYDPDSLPDPLAADNILKQGGRGVYLMRVFCDDIRFDKGGRAITLIFYTGIAPMAE